MKNKWRALVFLKSWGVVYQINYPLLSFVNELNCFDLKQYFLKQHRTKGLCINFFLSTFKDAESKQANTFIILI